MEELEMEICLDPRFLNTRSCGVCDTVLLDDEQIVCIACERMGFQYDQELKLITLEPKTRLQRNLELAISFLEDHGYGVYKQSDLKPVPLTQLPPPKPVLPKKKGAKLPNPAQPGPAQPSKAQTPEEIAEQITEMAKTDPIIAAKLKELESLQQKGGFKP